MSMNSGWGAGEMEDSFESIGEQEAYGDNGEASYYEQERNGTQSGIYGEAEGGYAQAGIRSITGGSCPRPESRVKTAGSPKPPFKLGEAFARVAPVARPAARSRHPDPSVQDAP